MWHSLVYYIKAMNYVSIVNLIFLIISTLMSVYLFHFFLLLFYHHNFYILNLNIFFQGILLEYYHERFREVAKELIELFGEDMALTAELWRELGCFEKSIEVCYKLTAAGKDVEVVRQIREHAEARDPNVFLLHFDD